MTTTLRFVSTPAGFFLCLCMVAIPFITVQCRAEETEKTLGEIAGEISMESLEAYKASPYSVLSKDYFSRFIRDPEAKPAENEVSIGNDWQIVYAADSDQLVGRMAGHLVEFLSGRMQVDAKIDTAKPESAPHTLYLQVTAEPVGQKRDSFLFHVEHDRIVIRSQSPEGIRDGIVHIVQQMGLRQAPLLEHGKQVYEPRLRVRLGATPWLGSTRDLVFMGYNAIFVGGGSIFAFSQSDVLPDLVDRRAPGVLEGTRAGVAAAREYGLKPYAFIDARQKFPKDHPIFTSHPDVRGALTWQADGEYTICTEHPLVQKYHEESIRTLFKEAPGLAGVTLIIGGEGFYHCFMRAFGAKKGHTTCARCEPMGGETVVANLCNRLAAAAREINPEAEVIAWPYSAEHVWSLDKRQIGLIEKMKPGTGILTEIEKDEYVAKPDGVSKHLWDYSIDLIGPGERAKAQIEACQKAGIPCYLKSEPELGFEAPRLPHIPCMDRWADRAEALASCGAEGAFVFPAFRPCYGTAAADVNGLFWWSPTPNQNESLEALAGRIAGNAAGPHLRESWKHVSASIPHSPELPPYYTGPYHLGPAHPMCASREAKLPEIFDGYYFFMAEIMDAEGTKKRPTYFIDPRGNRDAFEKSYRRMESELAQAATALEKADPLVPESHRVQFDAEASSTRWFYHTARTHANFYESCRLRDKIQATLAKDSITEVERAEANADLEQWKSVLLDEKANSEASLPVMQGDVRLNLKYGGDHSLSDGAEMIRAKLELLEWEIGEYLPGLQAKLN